MTSTSMLVVKDSLFLLSDGKFKVVTGADAETPTPPKGLDDAMKISEITFEPICN